MNRYSLSRCLRRVRSDAWFEKGHGQGNWNELDIKRAVMAVTVNHMSQKKAANMCNIPRETLRRHLKKLSNQLIL
jgi:DNA-binding NtrC family response regulator